MNMAGTFRLGMEDFSNAEEIKIKDLIVREETIVDRRTQRREDEMLNQIIYRLGEARHAK